MQFQIRFQNKFNLIVVSTNGTANARKRICIIWRAQCLVWSQYRCLPTQLPYLLSPAFNWKVPLSAPHFPTYCFTLLYKMDLRPISENNKCFWVRKCLQTQTTDPQRINNKFFSTKIQISFTYISLPNTKDSFL